MSSRLLRLRLVVGIGAANVVGAVTVFLYLVFVLPPRQGVDTRTTLNMAVFAGYLLGSLVLGRVWAQVQVRATRWFDQQRTPTEREARTALRMPARDVAFSGGMWLVAALLFSLLNLPYSPALAGDIARTVVLGGLTTSAVGFLIAERLYRPLTLRALEPHAPGQLRTLGVGVRVVLVWALSTGIPLLGIGLAFLRRSPAEQSQLGTPTLFLVVVGLVTGFFAMSAAARSVAEPLARVRRALAAVQSGRLDVEVPVDDGGEIGQLEHGVNAMVAGLRERQRLADLFGRHVGEDVARQALARGVELGGESAEASVLFVDVIGSTTLAQTTGPHEVVAALNAFFTTVVDVVQAHGGWVNKFEGDGALCVFGVPSHRPDHASCALAAARALRTRLRSVPGLEAGIGLASGPVVAGNVGAHARFEYTVIGDPVNEAARLTELAKTRPSRLLASEAAVAAAGEEGRHWRLAGEQTLRGRTRPTQLAEPA